MRITYDMFGGAFLSKITEYEFLNLYDGDRQAIVDGYMKRAIAAFRKSCLYDFVSTRNEDERVFDVEVEDDDIDELVDIISEGMLVQWMKPYIYKQELLSSQLNTRDFTLYSPAELLKRVGDAYQKCQKDYTRMVREYSFNHSDLSKYHT